MADTVWIVGKLRAESGHAWEFVGAFSNEALAVAACTMPEHFVGPVEMDVRYPDEALEWPGSYQPIQA